MYDINTDYTNKMKTEADICEMFRNNVNGLKKLCRICLTENMSDFVPLFGQENTTLSQKIMLCTGIQMEPDDDLPSVLCSLCSEELNRADTFRTKCETSDNILKKAILIKHNDGIKEETQIDLKQIKQEKMEDGIMGNNISNDFDVDKIDSLDNETIVEVPLDNTKVYVCDESANNFDEFSVACSTKSEANLRLKMEPTIIINKRRKKKDDQEDDTNDTNIAASDDNADSQNLETKKKMKRGRQENLNFNGSIIMVDDKKMYKCPECDYHTPYKNSLIYHVNRHTGEKPFVCELCNKGFTQPGTLISHKKTHSDKMYYTCPICGRQFKHKNKYEYHKTIHSTQKKFVCTLCDKVLRSNETLKLHMNRHYNVKNYSCETCGSTFVSGSELANHSKIHKDDKKFACHLCEYRTYKKITLEKHLKYHSGEKEFKCDLCDAAYSLKTQLAHHNATRHAKEKKKYPCTICSQKYNHSGTLNKHMLRVHKVSFKWKDVVDRRTVK